jgi:hypothetical protein
MLVTKPMHQLEYSTAQDLFYDFCLWEYKPLTSTGNKLNPSTLLFHSFEVTGLHEKIFDLVQVIRKGFGVSQTVWGVKKIGSEIRWEFYFYDYRRRERERSITKFLEIISPFALCRIKANENLPYFMFSVDVDELLLSRERELDEIHMYIGNPGSTVSSGICYSLKERGTRLENFYFFFDAKKQMNEIVAKASCSAHIDSTIMPADVIFWPEMRDCGVIVVANKQNNDSLYFSRIKIDQLIFFLNEMRFPTPLLSFMQENRSRLDHLLYDVGFDYRMDGNDLIILKSAYYGIF